jgi:hypothetical protein
MSAELIIAQAKLKKAKKGNKGEKKKCTPAATGTKGKLHKKVVDEGLSSVEGGSDEEGEKAVNGSKMTQILLIHLRLHRCSSQSCHLLQRCTLR